MKTRLTTVAKALDVDFDKLHELKVKKLDDADFTGTGRATWVTEEGVRKLEIAIEEDCLVPDALHGFVLHEAANPKWVFARVQDIPGKCKVLIPNKLMGRLVGKRIQIHAIRDAEGVTYRHADLTSKYSR